MTHDPQGSGLGTSLLTDCHPAGAMAEVLERNEFGAVPADL